MPEPDEPGECGDDSHDSGDEPAAQAHRAIEPPAERVEPETLAQPVLGPGGA